MRGVGNLGLYFRLAPCLRRKGLRGGTPWRDWYGGGRDKTMIAGSVNGPWEQSRFGYQPGNQADFERLYSQSYDRILGNLTVVLSDRSAAEDCAQDAFERAFKKWPTWAPIAPPEAWVHRIARNAAVSYQRSRRIREVDEVIRRIGLPVERDHEDDAELTSALARLPAAQAQAMVLRHYHGYSNRTIARALGIPEGTVASRVRGAKARLRTMLG
jgi:RNA polymerase sigma-70 factor (ECF subfamily)